MPLYDAQYSTQHEYQMDATMAAVAPPRRACCFPYLRSNNKKSSKSAVPGVAWRAKSNVSGMRMRSGASEADVGSHSPTSGALRISLGIKRINPQYTVEIATATCPKFSFLASTNVSGRTGLTGMEIIKIARFALRKTTSGEKHITKRSASLYQMHIDLRTLNCRCHICQ